MRQTLVRGTASLTGAAAVLAFLSALLTLGFLLMPGALFPPFSLRAVGGSVEAWALGWIGLDLWRRTRGGSATA